MRKPSHLSWLFIVVMLAFGINLEAQQNYWQLVEDADIAEQADEFINISVDVAQLARLDNQTILQLLKSAPHESQGMENGSTIAIPLPDGSFENFRIVEAPILAPSIAAEFPTHKDYRGHSIDNPGNSIRLGWTIRGFHAMILGADYRVFIDPYRRNDTENYIVYYRSDYVASNQAKYSTINCSVRDHTEDGGINIRDNEFRPDGGLPDLDLEKSNGADKRTYRLALSANQNYVAFWGGVPAAFAGAQTTVARVTGIYEREFAVCFSLVSNTSTFFTDNTFSNDGSSTMGNGSILGDNQTILDGAYGSGGYDIGHVFTTGSGGFAFLGVVCNNGFKAGGTTGLGSPTGDVFDVDYVAHEIGHQCGGNHTFNATSGACGGGNRNNGTAYEPGSASTIMGYAGICGGADNVQSNSDDYFHIISHDEIQGHLITGSGNGCANTVASGNTPPTANANPMGGTYTIPVNTPFQLTGSSVDPNGMASLTYCWEEFDLGPAGSINGVSAPFFRSFDPSPSPTRTFPELSQILNGSNDGPFEKLPTVTTTLNFRLSVRDNQEGMFGGAGGFCSDQITIDVSNTATNFMVTVLNTPGSLTGLDPLTINWNVGGTDLAPVSCANVNIEYSLDGGMTWTTVATNQPNNGTWMGTVPNADTPNFRVRVVCSDNIFFDINDADIMISSVVPVELLSFDGTALEENIALDWTTASELDNDYFQVEHSLDGEKFVPLAKIQGAGTTLVPQSYRYIDITPTAGINYYRLKQVDFDGTFDYSETIAINFGKSDTNTKVYPSPAMNVLHVSAKSNIERIEIFDLTGRTVAIRQTEANTLSKLNVANLLSGTYFIHILLENGNTDILRFVRQ